MTERSANETLQVAIDSRLADMPRHHRALRFAVAEFGEDFDREVFVSATSSTTSEELNSVYAVERAFEVLQNYLSELVSFAAQLAGLAASDERRDLRRNLERLQQSGMLRSVQAKQLRRLQEIRNLMVHEYAEFKAELVHEGVTVLLEELPRFMKTYEAWLEDLGEN